jgi:diguanylate cyclase (GGDEF)-like protein
MHTPAPHPHESRRRKALLALHLLDTPIEERFERITRAARQMLRTPIAAISLVDEARQWFKSVQGLEACESPRNLSFCAHAILQEGSLVVPDATRDERFADNPMVCDEPWIRFYAGHPLRSTDGLPVGTLCVADRKPRRFTARDKTLLRSLAQAAEAELHARMPGEAQRRLVADLQKQGLSAVDTLTRVWGRDAILDLLEREFQQARKKGTGIGTFIADVDGCERIAEALGHEASAIVVRNTARRMLRSLRAQDALGRFGSGEFLAVVSTPDRAELAAIAQRVRTRIARTPMRAPKGAVEVTVSLGGAWAPAAGLRTPGALLDAANYALVSAQRRGGNRVEVRAA